MPIATHYSVMLHFLSVQIYCHRCLCSAEMKKKPYNHVTRIINHVMDVFVWLVILCIKSSICNFNSTGTLSTMVGYKNDYTREGGSCCWGGVWRCSGPGTRSSPWDVAECFPARPLCVCTLCWLSNVSPPRIQTHDANSKPWISVTR